MGILLSKLLNWVNIKFILCDWLTLPAVWENNTILQCVPGTVMYSGTSMGYFALQHNPSKPMGDTRNYTAVQRTWYPPIHIKKYIKNTQHLPAAHMRSWLTPAHCSRASARISMPSLFLSSPPPSASLSCLGQQVRWRSLLNTATVCCDILHCSSSLTGVALYPELDVPALKLFLVATWGTPPIQTDSSEGIRFALLSLAGLWQRRQRAVFPLDLWWINETNHSANKGFFWRNPLSLTVWDFKDEHLRLPRTDVVKTSNGKSYDPGS